VYLPGRLQDLPPLLKFFAHQGGELVDVRLYDVGLSADPHREGVPVDVQDHLRPSEPSRLDDLPIDLGVGPGREAPTDADELRILDRSDYVGDLEELEGLHLGAGGVEDDLPSARKLVDDDVSPRLAGDGDEAALGPVPDQLGFQLAARKAGDEA